MATKQEAAEQAKEFLRLMIKYRFWISIGVAALFATIAYFVGSRPIQAETDKERAAIKSAEDEVRNYTSPTIPTKDYMPIVNDKTQVLGEDVNKAWRTLYDRQAELLTWPESVQERFRAWGRTWPEKENPRKVELAIVDYIEAYPAYVSMVYKSCNPFDFETGSGIVSTPGEEALLRPAKFDPEHLPDLGKVWAAQERLWIQRTMLEVVAEVNKNAKSWDEATIRQIVELEVGERTSQDQRSIAKSEQLEESKGIYAKGDEPPPDSGAGAGAGGGVSMGGGKGGAMAQAIQGGAMGGGVGGSGGSETVFYVKSTSDKYKVMPILMTVLIDQDRVQNFLIELENSPMWIQLKDFELVRPSVRVAKPVKGEELGSGTANMIGMMGGAGMGRSASMGGMVGMGGMAQQQMMQQMQQQARSQQSMMSGMASMASMGGRMGGGVAEQEKKGKSMKGVDTAKQREAKAKAAREAKGPTLFDPYFNVVQVRIYAQARFFEPPPPAPSVEPSPGQVAGAGPAGGGPAGEPATKESTPPAANPGAAAAPAEKSTTAPGAASKAAASAQQAGTTPDAASKAAASAKQAGTAPDAGGRTPGAAKAGAAPDAKADPPASAVPDKSAAKAPKNDEAAKTKLQESSSKP